MPFTILTNKESATPGKPLVLIRIVAVDGDTVYFCTTPAGGGTSLVYGGNTYQARLQSNVIDQIQAMSPQGYDIPGAINLKIADGDLSVWTNHVSPHGWRGATITAIYVHWDIPTNAYSTDAFVWTFLSGKANMPSPGTITVEGTTQTSMARLKIPNVTRQRRCPWVFPSTSAQRSAGLNDPSSIYYQCGYSPDQTGGVGDYSSGTTPFASCDYTRESCKVRGMFSIDHTSAITGRFGGDTWKAPSEFSGTQYTTGQKVYGFNQSTFGPGQYYPMVYGLQWVNCAILEPAADPSSLRAEVVACIAPDGPAYVRTLNVNGVQVSQGGDKLFTWRYVNQGGRNGSINHDAIYDGAGDPHGSQCCLEFVVPSQLAAGGSTPSVRALIQGPPTLQIYPIQTAVGSGGNIVITFPGLNMACAGISPFKVGISGNGFVADGFYGLADWTSSTITIAQTGTGSASGGYVFFYVYSTNPVWHLMDLMTWGPWKISDFDARAWFDAAAFCDVAVTYTDMYGNAGASHARYKSSFALEQGNRQALSAAVTALRANAGIILSRNPATGLIQASIERTLADQQPAPVDGSNYSAAVASIAADGTAKNGYLAYLFDGAGSILKDSFVISGRGIQDMPNRVAFQFQDEDNKHQQDSISTIDPDGYTASGNQEVDVPLQIMGISNFDQGTRRSNVELAKATRGNLRADAGGTEIIEFTSTCKAVHLASKVGSICGINYAQLGFVMTLARLLSASPTDDAERWKLKFQLHLDQWHVDSYGQNPTPFYRQPGLGGRVGPPYPWAPAVVSGGVNDSIWPSRGNFFDLALNTDSYPAHLSMSGNVPVNVPNAGSPPLVPLQASTANTGGTIVPGTYVVRLSSSINFGPVSEIASVIVPAGTNTNTVTISGITWPGSAFPNWSAYIGTSSMKMALALNGVSATGSSPDANGNPTVVKISAVLDSVGLPDVNAKTFVVREYPIQHGGAWGDAVTSVSGSDLYFAGSGAAWTVNQWAGRVLSLYYRPGTGDAAQPLLNFTVVSNTADTLTLNHPGFQAGDVVVMRFVSQHISSTTIGDDLAINNYAPAGLDLTAEKGRQIQILAGTGAGQPPKTILSNTSKIFTISQPWDVTPDATSVWIVTSPTIAYEYQTKTFTNDGTGGIGLIDVLVAQTPAVTTEAQSLLIEVATADDAGNFWPMRYQPFREVYVPQSALVGTWGPGHE